MFRQRAFYWIVKEKLYSLKFQRWDIKINEVAPFGLFLGDGVENGIFLDCATY
jgi:hypothetical protein